MSVEPTYSVTTERLHARLPEFYRTLDEQVGWHLKTYLSAMVDELNAINLLMARLEYVPPEDENVIFYMFNPFSELLVIRCIESLAAVPLVPGKRRVLCFVQQRTHLATPVDLCRSSKAVRPLALRPMRFDWFSHPQLEASLFDVRASL